MNKVVRVRTSLIACTLSLCTTVLANTQIAFAPIGPIVSLDEVGLYEVGCIYRNRNTVEFPVGWSGEFDDATGLALRPWGEQHGKAATLLHCPWRGGTGVSFQQFLIEIPKTAKGATLKGAIAMGTPAVGKSDGATFRIYANGKKLLEENRKDDVWKEFSLDLSQFIGHALTLRFETDPGPSNDASFDFSLWGERKLILTGVPQAKVKPGSAHPLNLSAASSVGTSDVVPTDGDSGVPSANLQDNTATFKWTGTGGSMEYRWQFPKGPSDPVLGNISLRTKTGSGVQETPLATSAKVSWQDKGSLVGTRPIMAMPGYGFERTYSVGGRTAHLRVIGRLVHKSLVLDISCDQPVVHEFNAGGWGPVAYRRQVTVPYYSGQVQYLPVQNVFVNSFLDWTKSGASSQEGSYAIYGSLTDGSHNLLHERAVFAASWHLAGALPSIPNPKSPYITKVGGRIMLDSWGGKFIDIAHNFSILSDYGIKNCAVIVHDWQRSGYDNALPAHYPANASLGGDAAMKDLVQTGTNLGYVVSLHENYVDYYPNFEGFKESDIALDGAGKRVLAWYQPGTKIQSFAIQPNAILPLAHTQSPEIHARYGTNANYLDVHSAVPPWFHVDFRAGADGAGIFHKVWDTHRRLWAYERTTHGGPVFGEGNNHWYWSGLLDGVEAQFGQGWRDSQGTTAPLMVDFDLLRIHPLQANHGMGYYERWWPASLWGAMPPMSVLDQYRMQEVAYGHAGFLGGSTWSILPFAWLEHHLLTPVTAAYAGVPPQKIEYMVGNKWVSADEAAKAQQWDRVQVTYQNGLTITANSSPEPLSLSGLMLPQFGWAAQGAGVKAWTAHKDGAIADYAETSRSVFANARDVSLWNVSGVKHIRPTAYGFEQTGPRKFRIGYRWNVGETLNQDYHVFVHFSTMSTKPGDEGIRFQGDHNPPATTSTWKTGSVINDGPWDVTVPENVADGNYSVGVGLWLPDLPRPIIEGPEDQHGRIHLGTLMVSNNGQTIKFSPDADRGEDRMAVYGKDLNSPGKVIDFGTLRTNGSVHIVRQGNEWVMQTYPRNARFELELSVARFGAPKAVKCLGVKSLPYHPTVKAGYWKMMLNSAREYRWPAK